MILEYRVELEETSLPRAAWPVTRGKAALRESARVDDTTLHAAACQALFTRWDAEDADPHAMEHFVVTTLRSLNDRQAQLCAERGEDVSTSR